MQIVLSTDIKYIGKDIPDIIHSGDTIMLDDYEFSVSFTRRLENGNILLGNPNYQIECKE